MRCAALDTYSHLEVTVSYLEVTVTARPLTVAIKDAMGRPVHEATGVACAPLVLAQR